MDYEEMKKETTQRVLAPSVGDRYHEMFSFWRYVVHIDYYGDGDIFRIYAMDFSPPCDVSAEDAKRMTVYSPYGFKKSMFYSTGDLTTTSHMMCIEERVDTEYCQGLYNDYIKLNKNIETCEHDVNIKETTGDRFDKIFG